MIFYTLNKLNIPSDFGCKNYLKNFEINYYRGLRTLDFVTSIFLHFAYTSKAKLLNIMNCFCDQPRGPLWGQPLCGLVYS